MSEAFITIILSALISALTAITTLTLQNNLEFRRQIDIEFNKKKINVYKNFSDLVSRILKSVKDSTLTADERLAMQRVAGLELLQVAGDLWLVGSRKVVFAYKEWVAYTSRVANSEELRAEDARTHQSLLLLASIIIEMRRDTGLSRRGDVLSPENLLATFMPEFDK